MKVLVVGAAGYVASIILPALEAEHECSYFDRVRVPGSKRPTTVGDVNDQSAVEAAVAGREAILYLAMGVRLRPDGTKDVGDIADGFSINAQAFYRFLDAGLKAGVRRVVYASSLSVYSDRDPARPITEETPPTAFHPYGLTKRVGEYVLQAAGPYYPEAVLIALRLFAPRHDKDWRGLAAEVSGNDCPIGPKDTRALFLAALACARPGVHIIQAAGDVEGRYYPMGRAQELLGWRPRGE